MVYCSCSTCPSGRRVLCCPKMAAKEKIALTLSLILLVLLRLPSLADPKYYLDEGVYASVAYEIGQGGTLYQTTWDLKPPGIFYVYLFFQKIFGSQAFLVQRIFNVITAVITILGVYKLARLLKFKEAASLTAAFLAAVFLGLPFFETQIFNTENIFMVTSLFAFIFGLNCSKGKYREPFPFFSGFLFGTGQWLKIHPIFDLAAFGLFALYKFRLDKKFWIPFITGILTPILAMALFLISNGILVDFWETNFSYNLFYVEELPQINIFGNLVARTLLLVALMAGLIFLKLRDRISETSFFISLWFIFVLYGALLSARAYGHYFIPVLLPATLLISLLIQKKSIGLLLIPLPLISYVLLTPPYSLKTLQQRIVNDQANFYQYRLSYLTGKIDQHEFEKDFTPKPWRLRELKAYLDDDISKKEDVYIWGISPWANYTLERRPSQRYLMWFHVLGVGDRQEEVLKDLLTKMPEIIIVEDNQPEGEAYEISRPPFPALQNFIDTNYRFETRIAGYAIYRFVSLATSYPQ